MRRLGLVLILGVAVGCGWPATKMETVGDYAARSTPTVSSDNTYEAGSNYQLTYSPDGATVFVCADGRAAPASSVQPGAAPAC